MPPRKSRMIWKEEWSKTFLEACIHEVNTYGREGSAPKPTSWKNIADKLHKEHGLTLEAKQMRNHFDHFKVKYQAWVKLKKRTGNIYDPIKNEFNLTDEEWEMETKLNKVVGTLKTVPLLFPDLCTDLFEGATSTGIDSWGPSSTLPHPAEYTEHDYVNVDDTPNETPDIPTPGGASEASSGNSKHKEVDSNKRVAGNKRKGKSLDFEEEIIKFTRAMVEKNDRVEKSETDKDMDACMEKLDNLEWGEEETRYKTALLLFGENADVRKLWLRLKPSCCESWVMSMGRKLGHV